MKAKDFVNEKWTEKYKKSINCQNPKGFSQKAHCAGRKKNEDATATMPDVEVPDTEKKPGTFKSGIKKLGKVLGKGLGALDFVDAAHKFSKGDVPGGAQSTISGITYAVPFLGLPLGLTRDLAKSAGYDPLDYSSKAYPKGPNGETIYPITPYENKSNVLKGMLIAEQSDFSQMLKNITAQNPRGSASEKILLGKFLGSDQGTYARNVLGKNHKGWIDHITWWLKMYQPKLQKEFTEVDFTDLESLAYDMYENYLAKQGQLGEGEVVSYKQPEMTNETPADLVAPVKAGAKGLGKLGAKAIPFVGVPLAAADAAERYKNKDYVGAGLQGAATAAYAVPGPGQWVGGGLDALTMLKDLIMHPDYKPQTAIGRGIKEEVVSLEARRSPLVVAGSPYDWDIYDLRTNKMVANILGGDRHESPLYEIRIRSTGMTPTTRMLPTYVLRAGRNNNPPYKAYELVDTADRYGKIEKSPGPGGTTKLRPDQDDMLRHMFKVMGGGKYYGYDLNLVEEGLDQYEIIEKALGAKIMEIDDAMELGYTDWDPEDSSSIVYLGNQKNEGINEFFDTGGGGDGDDELKRQVVEMYFEDELRETEIARITGLSELAVNNIIDQYERGDFTIDEGYSAGAAGGTGIGEELNEYGEYDTRRIIQFSKDNPPDLDYLYQQFIQRMLHPENTVDPNEWISKVNEFYGLNYSWKDYQTRGRNDHTNNWQRIINRYVVNRK